MTPHKKGEDIEGEVKKAQICVTSFMNDPWLIIGPYQPSNEMMLQFYSYYKQATQGPCDLPKPSFWDVINKAKWNAWASLGQMTKEKAMQLYVVEIKKVKEF